MSFAHPFLLAAGLAGVSLPILIHVLFRRRRRPMAWAAMRFLEAAYRSQRRRLRLEQLLLLAARCLIVLLIALALARPFFGGSGVSSTGSRDVYFVLDDSITSAARETERSDLERSRAIAERFIERSDTTSGDRFGLVTLAGGVLVPPTANAASLLTTLGRLEPTDSAADWDAAAAALARLARDQESGRVPVVVLLSAFRAGATPTDAALPTIFAGAERRPRVVATSPAGGAPANVTIESVAPARPLVLTSGAQDTGLPVAVRLSRNDTAALSAATTTLRLFADAGNPAGAPDRTDPIAEGSVQWGVGQRDAAATLLVTRPAQAFAGRRLIPLRVEARPDDALARDNTARTVVRAASRVRVGVVARSRFRTGRAIEAFDASDWVAAALRPRLTGELAIEVLPIDPASIDTALLNDIDTLMILTPGDLREGAWAVLGEFARTGGTVAFWPAAGDIVHTWPDQLGPMLGATEPVTATREPVRHEPALTVRQPQRAGSGLFGFIAGELGFLLEPVRVEQALRLTLPDASAGFATVLELENGDPWLVEAPLGRGWVVLGASSIDSTWANLPAKPAFVPVMQELARRGTRGGTPASDLIAGAAVSPDAGVTSLDAIGPTTGPRSIDVRDAADRIRLQHAASRESRDTRGRAVSLTTVSPNLRGADLDPVPPQQLQPWLEPWAGDAGVTLLDPVSPGDDETGIERAMAATGLPRGFGWPLLVAAGVIAVLESLISRLLTRRRTAVQARRPA